MSDANRYHLGGLHVLSDVALPAALRVAKGPFPDPDVVVSYVSDVGTPSHSRVESRIITAGDRDFVVRPIPGLAFRIREGREITVSRKTTVPVDDARLYLTGAVWGVLCHQRGLIPLHCSAVEYRGRAFAFTGASGAGKSTVAAGLWRRGFRVISDDLCVLLDENGTLRLHPVSSDLRLCADAAEALALQGKVADRREADKLVVSPSRGAVAGKDIAALCVLSEEENPALSVLRGRARFEGLLSGIYRGEWLELNRNPREAFDQMAGLAQRMRVLRFGRPRNMARFAEGLALLEARMETMALEELAA